MREISLTERWREWPLTVGRYGPDLSCQPLSCGTPPASPQAEVRPECTSFRCEATITCLPGYTVREGSPATKICQADGTWTQAGLDIRKFLSDLWSQSKFKPLKQFKPLISGQQEMGNIEVWTQANIDCVPIHCPLPENPINGKALFVSTNFESVVNYEETFLYIVATYSFLPNKWPRNERLRPDLEMLTAV